MMSPLFQSTVVLVLFVLMRAGDIAIGAAIARDIVRTVLYGIVAVLALIAALFALVIH